ncbi:MAG: AIPR family protein [Deltaproteobacteria bacterium]|nr:AIPR family protein [Deltaproteobacteria bacterium]
MVNGCQTVSILNRPTVHRCSSETNFLVRIIATSDEDLKGKIATYTNSQTKVSERTLRSNDPIQKELQLKFIHWEIPYFYDCKEGEWDSLTTEQKRGFLITGCRTYRRISNVEAAKAYLAFNGKPIEAKSSPKLIWDLSTQGLYNFVFPGNRYAEELFLPFVLSQRFANHTEEVIKNLGENPSGNDALIKEYLGHADTTLLALAGYIISKAYNNALTIENLRVIIPSVESFSEALFNRCNSAIRYEVFRAKNEADRNNELFNPRNFFLRIEAYKNLKNKIDDDIDLLEPAEFYKKCKLVE